MTLEDFFKRIETQYNQKLPFVVYRKPNRLEVKALLQQSAELHFTSEFTEQGFVFSPFDNKQKTVLLPLEFSEEISASFVMSSEVETKSHNEYQINEQTKNHHINLIDKSIKAINKSQFKKVVVSRTETIDIADSNPINIYKNLLSKYASAFVYCWYHPKVGLWLGATPETLIKIEGNRLSIMALAGTQDYNGNLDVIWQEKEQQEQQFVTDFIINCLKSSAESLKVSGIDTVKAGNLLHLKTMISAQLKPDTSLNHVIKALHPTPAVCGLPKDVAKAFILKHENYNREFYSGFLGELNIERIRSPRSGKRNIENKAYAFNKNSTQFYVNLRCMQLKNNKALLYIGGGITKCSNAEKEWEETVSKSLVIKSVL